MHCQSVRSGARPSRYHCRSLHVRLRMSTAVKYCILCDMTGITHGQNKIALNSTSSFALVVECTMTMIVPNCGLITMKGGAKRIG